jgi:hypothetical protein
MLGGANLVDPAPMTLSFENGGEPLVIEKRESVPHVEQNRADGGSCGHYVRAGTRHDARGEERW